VVWVGSALAIVAAAALGLPQLQGASRTLLIAATVLFLAGVQAPTVAINLPLNNALQRIDAPSIDAAARQQARQAFEPSWNRANVVRTVCAAGTSVLLLVVLLRV
jgi:uncharacterized membrane protein